MWFFPFKGEKHRWDGQSPAPLHVAAGEHNTGPPHHATAPVPAIAGGVGWRMAGRCAECMLEAIPTVSLQGATGDPLRQGCGEHRAAGGEGGAPARLGGWGTVGSGVRGTVRDLWPWLQIRSEGHQ